MSTLKNDLDEYLLLQENQKKSFNTPKLTLPNSISSPNVFRWFRREEANNAWIQESQDCFPRLTRLQRIIGFILFMGMGILCMIMSTIYIPVLVLKARKFALLYSMGSVFFITGFSFLSGFKTMFKQLFQRERLFVSISYVLCLFATLYFAIFLKSTPLTVCTAVLQVIFLFLTIVSSIPGGSTGIKFFGQMFKSSVSSSLPI